MAKVKLSENTFKLIPEGKYIFKIVEVNYDEDFGKMKVVLQTKDGQKHTEQYMLLTKKGETNEGALKAFSYLARIALNNPSLDEIDHEDLVGCYISAEVTHDEFESNKEEGKMLKTARIGNYESASGFGGKSKATKEEIVEDDEDEDVDDLDDFLND